MRINEWRSEAYKNFTDVLHDTCIPGFSYRIRGAPTRRAAVSQELVRALQAGQTPDIGDARALGHDRYALPGKIVLRIAGPLVVDVKKTGTSVPVSLPIGKMLAEQRREMLLAIIDAGSSVRSRISPRGTELHYQRDIRVVRRFAWLPVTAKDQSGTPRRLWFRSYYQEQTYDEGLSCGVINEFIEGRWYETKSKFYIK